MKTGLPRISEAAGVDLFALACEAHGLPPPVREFAFALPRKWRFDYCWRRQRVALECEGGVWTRGRHTRGSGFVKDMEKYNEATLRGWKVLRCTPQDIETGRVFGLLDRVIKKQKTA